MRTLLLGCCGALVFSACGPKPATELDGSEAPVMVLTPEPPQPPQSQRAGPPATGAVVFRAAREATAPLTLNQAVTVDAAADTEVTLALPVDASIQGVWARVWLPEHGWLELDGVRQQPSSGGLVFIPLDARQLKLRVERAQRVELLLVAAIDSAGGGFEVQQEPTVTWNAAAGDSTLEDPTHTPGTADDTLLRLTRVEVRAESNAQVLLGRCDTTTPVRTFNLEAGVPVVVTELLPAGRLCTQSTAAVTLKLEVAGRVRRFSERSLRPVRPLTLLDTSTGVGRWLGAPQPTQRLDFDLQGLTGLGAGGHALLRVDAEAPVTLGACDSTLASRAPGEVVLVPTDAALCLQTSTNSHVRVTMLGLTTPRAEETGVCRAPPAQATCIETTMLGRLNCIPGVSATPTQMTPLPAGATQYLLRVSQPVDHFRPDGPTFKQRVLLTVRDEAAPMVLLTTGYQLFGYFSELATEFPVNQLEVEHRFFEDSTPSPLDYSTLTIMQSAWDSHRIVEALKPIFSAPWVTTGTSKGGMTALYHRRFFPCDVEVTVPYVTPLSLGTQDARYGPWLAQLGGPQWENCRLTFQELETGLIGRRAELAPTLNGTYSLVGGRENALWASTGSGYWSMFQSGRQADPNEGCPAWEPLRGSPEFDNFVEQYAAYAEAYADEALTQYPLDAYSYQTQNELGSPGGNRAHLEQFGPVPALPDMGALIMGNVRRPDFEARAMPDVQRWVKAHGERFIFVYGGFDPWSGGRVDSDGARDSFNYLIDGASHGADLNQLPTQQRDEAYGKLSGWLGVQRINKREKAANGARLPTWKDFAHLHRL